jgi:protoporphyrinogen/coproporphyrinogen III oxidase
MPRGIEPPMRAAYSDGMIPRRTVVVGAGLSGLACGFDLSRAGDDVVVLEAASRAGGVVSSIEKDGFLFEEGPHTIQASSEEFRQLCGDLSIAGHLISADGRAKRWLWFHGELVALPSSLPSLYTTKLLSRRAKAYLSSEPLRTFVPPDDGAPEPSFADFLEERIGREPTRLFAGAFTRGIYAAEIEELGARSAFPRLWQLACDHGGLVRGMMAGKKKKRAPLPGPDVARSSLLSFPRGLRELTEALARALGSHLRPNASVERIVRLQRGCGVVLANGASFAADNVVLAVPAPVAAALLDDLAREVAAPLRAIHHAHVTVVHLGLEPGIAVPAGFGYLVPPDAEAQGSKAPLALGTICTSNLFPGRAPAGRSSVASFYRGADVEKLDDARLVAVACGDLGLAIGATTAPRAPTYNIRRWSHVIPRYEPGHAARMNALEEELRRTLPGVELASSFVGGVSVDNVIARGRSVARAILAAEVLA